MIHHGEISLLTFSSNHSKTHFIPCHLAATNHIFWLYDSHYYTPWIIIGFWTWKSPRFEKEKHLNQPNLHYCVQNVNFQWCNRNLPSFVCQIEVEMFFLSTFCFPYQAARHTSTKKVLLTKWYTNCTVGGWNHGKWPLFVNKWYQPGTPRPTIYKWLFQLDDSQSLHRKWLEITKHPFINGWPWGSRN